MSKVTDKKKRDFIVHAANGMALIGVCGIVWPMVDSMNPAKDVLAMASVEVDLSGIEPGQGKKVMWRGKPVFIQRRTQKQIDEMREVALDDLKDPQKDSERVKPGHDEWLIMVGVCTHLGCIPTYGKGEYGGWFCPCHGSHYDMSGRIRKGPAALNMIVPPYEFVSNSKVKIG